MPELPEVETITQNLREGKTKSARLLREAPTRAEELSVVGKTITEAQVLWHRTLATPSESEFYARIIGQKIEDVRRRGKYLVFHLSNDILLVHLRMSGDMIVRTASYLIAPHDRLTLTLENDISTKSGQPLLLAFNDPRKFGRAWLVDDPRPILGKLGPEPLDSAFTAQQLYEGLQARRRQLKPLLLDQSFLAGLGNIYTDEALHIARLHPQIISNTISQAQAKHLWNAIRQVLQAGIHNSGASIDWVYRGGKFQNQFRVYVRTGEPCLNCGTHIARILVGQRSTHFCPTCQPTPIFRS